MNKKKSGMLKVCFTSIKCEIFKCSDSFNCRVAMLIKHHNLYDNTVLLALIKLQCNLCSQLKH